MDDVRERAAANCAGAYRQWAARLGHPHALWPDLSVANLGVLGVAPVNSACLLRPMEPEALADAMDRAEALFARTTGGPVQIWSAWPTADLGERGYRGFEVSGMVRPAGGSAPEPPPGLEVRPARSPEDLAQASLLIDEVFDCRATDPRALVADSLLGEDFEVLLGWCDGRAVATATAYVSDGFCGVYAVATRASDRGRGFGTALSWGATLFQPDLPATLQASPQGYPVYRRMGFQEFGRFALWVGPRPVPLM